MTETTTEPTEPAPRRRTAGIAVALVAGLLAGFLGGIAGGALFAQEGDPGPRGPRGAEGAQGEQGEPGKAGADAQAPTQLGVCYSTFDNSSGGAFYLTSVYISSPVRDADGTVSCPDGTYVPVVPQSYEDQPVGD